MKTNLIFVRMGGLMNLLAAVLHVTFWNAFNWSAQLTELSVMNSNIMQMLNLFVIVFFTYVGLLLLLKPTDLVSSPMGRHFLGLLSILWTARLAMEFYFPQGDLIFAGVLLFTIVCCLVPLMSGIEVKGRIDPKQHLDQDWMVHRLLEDFEIEDVWELPIVLTRNQPISDVQKAFIECIAHISGKGLAGMLFRFRFFLGRVFGWDDDNDARNTIPVGSIRERYASRTGLPPQDFSFPRGAQFIPVYQTKNESLAEIENQTVHAGVHYSKVSQGNDRYKAYMTVYVKPKGLFGRLYMKLIMPFRLFIVYPVMLKVIGQLWQSRQVSEAEQELIMA